MASGFEQRFSSPSGARAAAAEIGAGWARPSAKRAHGQTDSPDTTPAKKPRDEKRPSEEVSGSLRSHFREQRSLGVSLRKLFHAMDEDHTGSLSMEQFGAALQRCGMSLTHSDLQALEGALATREGLVSYERLLAFIESDSPPADEAHSRARLVRRRRVGGPSTASGSFDNGSGHQAGSGAAPADTPAFEVAAGSPSADSFFAGMASPGDEATVAAMQEDARRTLLEAAASAAAASADAVGSRSGGEADGATLWQATPHSTEELQAIWTERTARPTTACSPPLTAQPRRKRPQTADREAADPDQLAAALASACDPRGGPSSEFVMLAGGALPAAAPPAASLARAMSGSQPLARRPRLAEPETDEAEAPAPAPAGRQLGRRTAGRFSSTRRRMGRAAENPAKAFAEAAAAGAAAAAPSNGNGRPSTAAGGRPAPSRSCGPAGAGRALSDFTVIAHALAAIAKLSAASVLSERQITAAKMVAFDTHPLVREAVGAFGATGDETELLLSMHRAAVAISGEE